MFLFIIIIILIHFINYIIFINNLAIYLQFIINIIIYDILTNIDTSHNQYRYIYHLYTKLVIYLSV